MSPELSAFFEGETFAVKTYSDLINIIRYAGVTIFHPDTYDFGLFSDVEKMIGTHSEYSVPGFLFLM
jgi:hypothetical protein